MDPMIAPTEANQVLDGMFEEVDLFSTALIQGGGFTKPVVE